MAVLIYFLMAFPAPAPDWHSSIALHETTDPARCEAIKALIEQAPSTGMRYECATQVKPK